MRDLLRLGGVYFLLLMVGVVRGAGNAEEPSTNPGVKAVDPSFVVVADEAGLPRVLIIGDSISMGYTLPVRKDLEGVANVHRPAMNCGDSGRAFKTQGGKENIENWLNTDGSDKWAVITFNFGLHDLKYLDAAGKYVDPAKGKIVATLDGYEKNLRAITERLKKTGAKLIWVNTTPVPAGTLGRIKDDEIKYNEVAAKVMGDEGVTVVDLWAVAHKDQAVIQRPKNVHYTDAGWEELGKVVAGAIEGALKGWRI
jgi:hypothetical protein